MDDNTLLPDVEAMTDTWAGESGYYQWRLTTLAHPNFLRLFVEEQRSIRYATAHMARKATPAVVYFVQQGDNGPIKIGASRSFTKRLKTLRTNSPVELHVLGTFPGGFDAERDLHHELADHRLEGEWFAPSPPVLSALRRLACAA
ncbi:GIY-YIG nuclease family protein [Curtobacterium sp. UCD-KPL2560]|uniref:GIY-YIG nuclease family protein n=1 Tax=Curtobacterium sp. UCD-KPL2560 TaxID=1885315 RepID=UPI001495A94D|nr:GIY-YIG nuclease family protein [Curtobacterium sp. UCD-KPL2560]